MDASSIPYKLSLCADRAHACAGDSYVSSGIDVACPTTQRVIAIASPHESPGDSCSSSSTGTSSFCCNQQYSVTAITTSTGSIAERYAYSAYGQPTVLDASASVLSSSAINNRYKYTGREWDATLGLHHFRARWMSPSAGRFLSRDPIGYGDSISMYTLFRNRPYLLDPSGRASTGFPPGNKPSCQVRHWIDPPPFDCCNEAKKAGMDEGNMGGIICCFGTWVACVWGTPQDVNPIFDQPGKNGEPLASGIILACILEHEKVHLKQPNPKCGENDFTRPIADPQTYDAHECEAARSEQQCLINNYYKCGTDNECKRAIRLSANELRNFNNPHCRQAGLPIITLPPGSFP